MDAAIDLSDASKALDLANIRFQLMYASRPLLVRTNPSFLSKANCSPAASRTQSPST